MDRNGGHYARRGQLVQVVLLPCTRGLGAACVTTSPAILPGGVTRTCWVRFGACVSAWAEAANGALAAIVTAATAAGSRRRKRRLGRTWRKWSLVMRDPSRSAVGAACELPGSLLSLDLRASVGRRTGTPLP